MITAEHPDNEMENVFPELVTTQEKGMSPQERGKKGGTAVREKYGKDFYQNIGAHTQCKVNCRSCRLPMSQSRLDGSDAARVMRM
ncbi:hypothetical protein Pelo_16438 [Pelomyxa schiedti]|nr:hypothetical protein Pelo_16438 [Pelomyxa schiedti]